MQPKENTGPQRILDQATLNIYNEWRNLAQQHIDQYTPAEAARRISEARLQLMKFSSWQAEHEEKERQAREAERIEQARTEQEAERLRQSEMALKIEAARAQAHHQIEQQRVYNEQMVAVAQLANQIVQLPPVMQERILMMLPAPGEVPSSPSELSKLLLEVKEG